MSPFIDSHAHLHPSQADLEDWDSDGRESALRQQQRVLHVSRATVALGDDEHRGGSSRRRGRGSDTDGKDDREAQSSGGAPQRQCILLCPPSWW